LFESNFKKEFYFKKLDKALDLLKLIDEIKHNLTLYQLKKSEDIDKDYLELKEYFENKSIIINLSLCYFPSLKESISEYDISIEAFTLIKSISNLNPWKNTNEKLNNDKIMYEMLNNQLKHIEQVIEKFKNSISNYLLEEEKKIK